MYVYLYMYINIISTRLNTHIYIYMYIYTIAGCTGVCMWASEQMIKCHIYAKQSETSKWKSKNPKTSKNPTFQVFFI